MEPIDILLSLPPASARSFRACSDAGRPAFAASDPPGRQLGSGGGTAHLLVEAWRASGVADFDRWLASSRKLIVHGSGQSRRLPAYAAEGKPLLPLPFLPAISGQSPDQRLLDVQLHAYRRLFWHAPAEYRVMVTCGDVLLRSDAFPPPYPEADILIAGLHASPEEASHHGVLFCQGEQGDRLRFFLQKPTPQRIEELNSDHSSYLDTGVWLFSRRAIRLLLQRCGWDPQQPDAEVRPYELFDRFATALGEQPSATDSEVSLLRAAVLALPHARFFHFGTNRSVLNSVAQLTDPAEARRSFGHAAEQRERPVVLNSSVACRLSSASAIWIEASVVPAGWRLAQQHVLTGVPPNDWQLDLPAGICLDFIDTEHGLCLRPYGFDDPFRGRIDDRGTRWLGMPFKEWLTRRGLTPAEVAAAADSDIQDVPLFPLLPEDPAAAGKLVAWMIGSGTPSPEAAAAWQSARRFSASDLLRVADPKARQARRLTQLAAEFGRMDAERWSALCLRLDLETCSRMVKAGQLARPPAAAAAGLAGVHDAMLAARLGAGEREAFQRLRNLMVERLELTPVQPMRSVLEDQIVWGRSPIRLDLAGGWSDTPPYCLEHGGRVVNLAVDLNGQPPIQAFARICETPHIVLHSIDLGISERITTYEELQRPAELGGGFGIARAALRLAGLDPRFHAGTAPGTLSRLLERAFGGGIELNMLAAIPKGSGLGTSSILAATILGTLGDLCGLHWTQEDLFARTLVLEQMLGSGGGWQDQVGGIVGGLKRIETTPGLVQRPVVRWLPTPFIRDAIRDRRMLLYYTGITRVAHNILGEIVRGIFLNDAPRLAIIEAIAFNADFAADVIQRQSWQGLAEAVGRSWALNQALDSGTNPPAVQAILQTVRPWLASAKLLGAGGGGYLLLLGNDDQAGARIRTALTENPPNAAARFVDLSISDSGLQVTRS